MPDTQDDLQAVMRSIYEEMWNAAKPAAARRIFAHPEGVEKFVRGFLAAFPDLQHTLEETLVEGDRAAARFSARGTHRGEWQGLAPTGKPVRYTGVTLARITDGKIAEHRTWWDKAGLIEQITGDVNRPGSQ